ncbi:hypothetical protein HIM_08972 [Hirsutella minnesotensis 3608]|uniref:Enterotoxin n=1 Tax=Hirsutella minnesotensis 3608 TaxID=1043627 RepID=A0A0F7ZM38_9HYPO|nr:hypothetical protein HIM_08972 [Hirsutella minnesotensis 3608]
MKLPLLLLSIFLLLLDTGRGLRIPQEGWKFKQIYGPSQLNRRGLDPIPYGPDVPESKNVELKRIKTPYNADPARKKIPETNGFSVRAERSFTDLQGKVITPLDQFKEKRGIWPRNYNTKTRSPYAYEHPSDEYKATSLYEHVNGQTKEITRWVSMTKSMEKGIEFSAINENGVPSHIWTRPGQDDHVVWKIQDASNVIDTHGSLANRGQGGNFIEGQNFIPNGYDNQIEYSAFEGIPTEQVKGYFRTEDLLRNPGLAERVAKGEEPPEFFIKNPDYNPKFDTLTHSGPRPELAGFPPYEKSLPGSTQSPEKFKAWDIDPWSKSYRSDIGQLQGLQKQNVQSFAESSSRSIKAVVCGIASKRDGILHKRNGGFCNPDLPLEPEIATDGGKDVNAGEDGIRPAPEKLPPTNQEQELALAAETASEREFTQLMDVYKLNPTVKERWAMSPSEFRAKALGYKRLEPSSPLLRQGGIGKALSSPSAVVGVTVWGVGILDAFLNNRAPFERFAAFVSIVPGVGCVTQVVAGGNLGLDEALCLFGDGLILGGVTAPVGIAVHIVRFIIQLFKPPPALPTKEETKNDRDRTWNTVLRENLYGFLYSHEHYHAPPIAGVRAQGSRVGVEESEISGFSGYVGFNGAFRTKLESRLAFDAAAVLSEGARSIGVINATSARASQDANTDQERNEIQAGAKTSIQAIQDAMRANVTNRHRNYLITLPASLENSEHVVSLKMIADNYNGDLMKKLTSKETIEQWPANEPALGPGLVAPKANKDRYSVTRKHMQDVAGYLRDNPPRIPGKLDIAYVLGQSRGLNNFIDPLFFSPQAYMKEQWPAWEQTDPLPARVREALQRRGDPSSLDELCIHYAVRVALTLQGKFNDRRLISWDHFDSDEVLDGLRILTAMRFGRVYEDWKQRDAKMRFSTYLPRASIPYVALPAVPPISERSSSPEYIGLILGLSEVVVEAALRSPDSRSRELAMRMSSIKTMFNKYY